LSLKFKEERVRKKKKEGKRRKKMKGKKTNKNLHMLNFERIFLVLKSRKHLNKAKLIQTNGFMCFCKKKKPEEHTKLHSW
jgi:hypothetical protein